MIDLPWILEHFCVHGLHENPIERLWQQFASSPRLLSVSESICAFGVCYRGAAFLGNTRQSRATSEFHAACLAPLHTNG